MLVTTCETKKDIDSALHIVYLRIAKQVYSMSDKIRHVGQFSEYKKKIKPTALYFDRCEWNIKFE